MNTKITVENTVNAEPKKVWKYWNEPDHIKQWNFASPDWHCPKVSNDLRVGGKLSSRMEAKDGSFGFDFNVIYDEVEPQKKISYTMEDGRKATTTFEYLNGKTKVTTSFDAESENPLEMQRGGWQAILDNFKKHTENN
ncbi:MAG: SRPBCC family protein [Aequorivita sp.]|nr:SRPBCC family protein [Aequorivita sp.]